MPHPLGGKLFGMPWKFLFEFTIYDRIAIRKNSSNASISAEKTEFAVASIVCSTSRPYTLEAENVLRKFYD